MSVRGTAHASDVMRGGRESPGGVGSVSTWTAVTAQRHAEGEGVEDAMFSAVYLVS